MFSSPVVGRQCISLGAACTFNVLLTGYNATVVDGDVSRVGVGMIFLRVYSEQEIPSVVVYYKTMVGVSKTIGRSLEFAHMYLVIECFCEVLTPFFITVVTASTM